MSWNWGSPPAATRPASISTPAPASSGGGSPDTTAPAPAQTGPTPGSIDVNLLAQTPVASYQQKPDAGFGGGVIGDAIGLGVNALGAPFKLAADAIQGVDKVIGTGVSALMGNRAQMSQINVMKQFNDAPDTPEKQAVAAEMAKTPNDQYQQAQVAFAYLNKTNAYLFPTLQTPVDATATGLAWNLISQFAVAPQAVERVVAGAAGSVNILPFVAGLGNVSDIGQGGNRLQNIQARLANPATAAGVNDTEKWAADQVASGQWDTNQALDFLAGHGAGYSGDFIQNLMGEMVLDPTIGVPVLGEAAKLAEVGRGVRVGAELATGFSRGATSVNVLRGVETMAASGDRVASTLLKVGGLVRDTMDPLGAIWGRAPAATLLPGETAAAFNTAAGLSTDAIGNFAGNLTARIHWALPGSEAVYRSVEHIGGLVIPGGGSPALSRMQQDVSTAVANIGRRQLLKMWVAQHLAPGSRLSNVATKAVLDLAPDSALEWLIRNPPKDFGDLVTREMMRVAEPVSGVAQEDALIQRMIRAWGGTPDQWKAEMAGWSDGAKSLAHLATYGNETGNLVGSIQRIMEAGGLPRLHLNPRDLILMKQDTLTENAAKSILRNLGDLEKEGLSAEEIASLRANALEVASEAMATFPKVPRLTLTGTGEEQLKELRRLQHFLSDAVDRGLPKLVQPDEIAVIRTIDPGLADMHDRGLAGETPWKLGVAPPEDQRWGLVRDTNGEWTSLLEPWPTHVATNVAGYKPLSMRVGLVNGKWGRVGSTIADGVDTLQNAVTVMNASITSGMVTQNASDRMVKLLGSGRWGFTKEESQALTNELLRTVGEKGIPARGLTQGERFSALESLIPTRLRAGVDKFTPTDLTAVVMRAFQGDLRVVGATQYFTGALKVKAPQLGILAERIIPYLRYTISPTFQTQMRLEGAFWNILRGNHAAFGPVPNKLDLEVYQALQHAAGTSVQRAGAELDASVEMSAQALHGQELAQIATDKWGATWWDKISNTKGSEQLNYIRTIESDLMGSLEKASQQTGFDLTDVLDHLRQTNPTASNDQLAAHYFYEQMVGQPRVGDVVQPGERVVGTAAEASVYAPVNMGKAGVVDGDGFLKRAPIFSGERKVESVTGLRKEIASGRISDSQVRQHLSDLNVPRANADRFMRYVKFDWRNFWSGVRSDFSLTRQDSDALQAAVEAAAHRHGVTPSDYLSQVVNPVLGRNETGAARIGTAPAIDPAGNYVVGNLSILRSASDGSSTKEDLAKQLADVFMQHLEPSGREALMTAFNVDEQRLAERVAQEALARGEIPEPPMPPDAERVMREFGAWSTDTIKQGLLKGRRMTPQMSDLLDRIGLIPKDFAVPYNFTEAQFRFAALDYLAQKENDAFALMYWRRSRSWAERTINHPMFGIYPASYMWGKVAPNFIKFLAKDQFGLHTAAGLAAVRNAQLALAARYEFDPSFQAQVDKVGASKALWFVSYMLPGAPWDLGASAPAWTRELFRQADANATRRANGQEAKPLDLLSLLQSEDNFFSPVRQVTSATDALSEAERAAEGATKQVISSIFTSPPPPLSEPVHASQLAPLLSPVLEDLQQRLLGQ